MKKAILLVAYGAGTMQARRGLAHFEYICRHRFPDWPCRWAYTSSILRERLILQKRKSDSVPKALMRLRLEKFDAVAVQPLQTLAGREHEETRRQILDVRQRTGMACAIGQPLLAGAGSIALVARALLTHVQSLSRQHEQVIFMGHGARHRAAANYAALDREVRQLDPDIRIGAMTGECGLDMILPQLKPGPVWIMPLLSTIGQHALRDMAGSDPDSWRSRIEAAGHECRPVLTGMAESDAICGIWLDNLADAMSVLR